MKNGPYELVKAPEEYPGKRYRGKYVYEHQLVWWQNTGELVPDDYIIHHKDENKRNNTFSNLELKSRAVHTAEHNEVKTIKVICDWCKCKFELKPSKLRDRIKQRIRKKLFCSISCSASDQFSKPLLTDNSMVE